MANFVRVIVLLTVLTGRAFAGYAQAVPTPVFSPVSGGTLGQMAVRVAANDAVVATAANDAIYVRSAAASVVNVGGRSVTMPVAARVAANAGRIVGAAAYLNPALMIAAGAAVAYMYYKDQGLDVESNKWVKRGKRYSGTYKIWERKYGSLSEAMGFACEIFAMPGCVAVAHSDTVWSACYKLGSGLSCPATIQFEGELIDSTIPVGQDEFLKTMENVPLTPGVVRTMPFPIPVEDPVLNPAPLPDVLPAPDYLPAPRPLRVPQGDPVAVPDTNPQQYKTPAIDIVPSPTVGDPWRVDVQPKDIITTDPKPLPPTSVDPENKPPNQTEKPKEDTPGLCDLYPDILACAKPELDTPEADQVKEKEIDISINPDGGWGSGGGRCPAPRHLNGANVDFDLKGVCDGLGMLRPIVLAFAWLAAAVIVVGASKKE